MKSWITEYDGRSSCMIISAALQEIRLHIGKEVVKTNTVYKPNNMYNSLQEAIWEDYEECVSYAKQFSLEISKDVLVARVVAHHNWH